MSDELRALLEDVAAGKISADDAAAKVEQLSGDVAPAPADEPVARLVIKGGAVRMTITGDPAVAEAIAVGPHTMRRDGDALVIDTNAPGDYSTQAPRSALLTWVGQMVNRVGATVDIRVNPDLPLQVLLVGGGLEMTGVRAGASVGVEAGSAQLSGSGPLLLDVASGSGKVAWTFTGESRVRADMGSVYVTVAADSDVAVTAEASLGQAVVHAAGGVIKAAQDVPTEPIVVGDGSGRLTVIARMGAAQVTVP